MTLIQLPVNPALRVRFEAARIHKLRRPITQHKALKALDAALIREALAAGLRRGAALSWADTMMDAVHARLAELDQLPCRPLGRLFPLQRRSA